AFLEPGQLTGVVEVVDHLVAAGKDRAGVDLAGHGLPGAGHAAGPLEHVAGTEPRLRGSARVGGALTAHQVPVDDRDAQGSVGEAAGAVLPRRPRAHDYRVELGFAHAANLPARRTIDPDISTTHKHGGDRLRRGRSVRTVAGRGCRRPR